jgi:RNA polymerase sigma factor (sigma-70 family)
MASGTLVSVVRYLRRVAGGPAAEEPTDGQLLRRFVAERDQAAFALLLERHGAMVLGVCGRVLDDPNDVDDAFQASFLVLVRKASSIRKTESLASWLYGVAQRTAHKARCTAARRRARERQVPNMPIEPVHQASWSDLRPLLDEELSRLPEKYRAPLVLCYLEGKTNEEAARRLGWTKGTVSGRLARARELLRGRLSRRGITLSGSVLATLLMQQSAKALVPATLADATLKAAVAVAAGQTLASTSVTTLTEGVVHAMFLTKMKIAALVLFTIGVIGAGTGMLAARGGSGTSPKYSPAADGDKLALLQEKEQAAKPAADSGKDDKESIQGLWNLADFQGLKVSPPPEFKEKFKLLFDNGKLFGQEGGGIGEGTYSIDPSKKPKTLDLKVRDEPNGLKAIYTLEGDDLKICAHERPGAERPTEFKASDEIVILHLKREKSAEKVAAFRKGIKEMPAGAASRTRSVNNLKQIALAMHNYHSTFAHLPPAATYDKDGKALLSWRVLILPYVEQDALYRAFKLDEPWDSEHNKKLIAQMPKLYAPVGDVQTKEKNMTFYQVFTGKGTVFEGSKALKFQDILDGTSNTALVVEAGEPVIWTKPDDLPYDENKPLPKLGGLFKGAFNMATADGAVRHVKANFDEKIMRLVITRADGMTIDWNGLDKE